MYALRKLKYMLPSYVLRTVYFSLIDSYLNYGIILWGNAHKYILRKLEIYQKKALRIIANKQYNYPTNELFKNYNILKFNNIYQLNLGKLI